MGFGVKTEFKSQFHCQSDRQMQPQVSYLIPSNPLFKFVNCEKQYPVFKSFTVFDKECRMPGSPIMMAIAILTELH